MPSETGGMAQPADQDQLDQDQLPEPIRLEPRPKFPGWLLEAFTRAAIEWTREHHPERLRDEQSREMFHK